MSRPSELNVIFFSLAPFKNSISTCQSFNGFGVQVVASILDYLVISQQWQSLGSSSMRENRTKVGIQRTGSWFATGWLCDLGCFHFSESQFSSLVKRVCVEPPATMLSVFKVSVSFHLALKSHMNCESPRAPSYVLMLLKGSG